MFARRRLLPALLWIILASRAAAIDPDIAKRLVDYAAPLDESGYLSGNLLFAAAADPDPLRLSFGFADAERTVQIDVETQFCIASITKPMTAMVLASLAAEGLLSLDEHITRWAPEFPSGDQISLRDLATHAAGVPHRVTKPEEESQHFEPIDIVRKIEEQGLLFEPHTSRSYSSAGYTVLAYVLEQVTGQSYGDLMRDRLFAPMGMSHTVHCDGRPIPRRATSFVSGVDGPAEAPFKDYAFLAGAGSIYSTVDDLLRLARAFLDQEVLSESAWREFGALGWGSESVVTWSGSTNGFACWLEMQKSDRSVQMFLGNAGTGGAYAVKGALAELLAGRDPGAPPVVPDRVELSPAALRSVEGNYRRGGSALREVVARNGVLYMGESIVFAFAEDGFFDPMYLAEIRFERDDSGAVTGYSLTAPGLSAPMVFERVGEGP